MTEIKTIHNAITDIYNECQNYYQTISLSREDIENFNKILTENYKEKLLEIKEKNCKAALKHKILQLHNQLENIYEKYYFPPSRRIIFKEIGRAEFSLNLLNKMSKEYNKMEIYYKNNKILLDSIGKYTNLLERINILENRANDPMRFQNRGAQLLRDDTDKKNAIKELQKTQKELLLLSQEHFNKNGFQFSMNGQTISSFLETNIKHTKENKIPEGRVRSEMKRKQKFETSDSVKRLRSASDEKKRPAITTTTTTTTTSSHIPKPKSAKVLISQENNHK